MRDPVKRTFDVAVASLLLVVLSPLLLVLALLVRVQLGSPVLFRQARPGRGGELFTLVKFRTMRSGPGPDEERLTRLGRFLRRTSLDELPELLNVLRGDLSLVGPRPLLEEYLPLYSPEQARRHEVRPGVTGWAQVHGRNAITWDEKLALDVWYVEHRTFRLDCSILAKTLGAVLTGSGVSAPGSATTEPFLGSTPVGETARTRAER